MDGTLEDRASRSAMMLSPDAGGIFNGTGLHARGLGRGVLVTRLVIHLAEVRTMKKYFVAADRCLINRDDIDGSRETLCREILYPM